MPWALRGGDALPAMDAHPRTPPRRSPERPAWVAAAVGLGLSAGWMFLPAARAPLVACAIVAALGAARRLGDRGAEVAARVDPDPVALLAEHGVRELEAYLARHLAFAAYVERRDAEARAAGDPRAG